MIENRKPITETSFKVRRILILILLSLIYMSVFFQRTCPVIVGEEMAKSYNVEKSDLSIFSAIFFYPYGIMQLFAGVLADVMEPSLLIGISQIIAAIGAIISGLSKNIVVGCIGRFFVGLGCGPTYVSECRCIANWFELKSYPLFTGILCCIGGIGSIVAQGPLAKLNELVGWRNSFFIIAGITIFLSVLCLIFVKGNPTKLGYESVNKEMDDVKDDDTTIKEKIILLFRNLVTVLKNPWFWLVTVFAILSHCPYYNANGLWGGPYLRDVMGFSKQKTGNTLIFLSIGAILGPIYLPLASNLMNSRKWCLLVSSCLLTASTAVFYIIGDSIPYWLIALSLFIFGGNTIPNNTVSFALVREYYHPSVSASAVGSINFFTQIISGAFQSISSAIIKHYGEAAPGVYTWKGYKNGLWLLSLISGALAVLLCFPIKESDLVKGIEIDKEKMLEKKDEEPVISEI
jgi:sugar phosphate permease